MLDLPAGARRDAADTLASCPRLELEAGTRHFGSDLPDAVLYLVEGGLVLMSVVSEQRRSIVVVAGPGDILLPPLRDHELSVLVDAELTALTRDAYSTLLADPRHAAALANALAAAVANREESLEALARSPHVERVRAKLIQLARDHGKVVTDGVVIDMPLTHDLLAEMIGSARETVTWALRELTAEGFVSRDAGSYRLAIHPGELAAGL